MLYRRSLITEPERIAQLFVAVFSAAEGEAEGQLIGQLVKDLFEHTDQADLSTYVAVIDDQLVGAICFSRVQLENEPAGFMLSPVAVHSDHHGRGIGQALIKHGLNELKKAGARFALTYGDPRFYGKVGFKPISNKAIVPPFELSQPEGWLGQSLCERPIESLRGRLACVEAFSYARYW